MKSEHTRTTGTDNGGNAMLKAGITMQGTLHEQYGIKNQDAIRIFEAAGFLRQPDLQA